MSQEKEKEESLVLHQTVTNQEQNLSKFDAFNSLEQQKQFAEILINSRALPKQYTNAESVIMAANYGKELGFSFVTALNSIYYVSGKPSLSTQAMIALCQSNDIIHKTIEDYEVVYKKDKDDNFILDEKGNKTFFKDSDGEPVRRTTIEYIRIYKHLNNYISRDRFSYTTKEAKDAGLYKNVWSTYPKVMLWYRTYAFGVRRFAADVLHGLITIEEMVDVGLAGNVNYNLDNDGNIKIID